MDAGIDQLCKTLRPRKKMSTNRNK